MKIIIANCCNNGHQDVPRILVLRLVPRILNGINMRHSRIVSTMMQRKGPPPDLYHQIDITRENQKSFVCFIVARARDCDIHTFRQSY